MRAAHIGRATFTFALLWATTTLVANPGGHWRLDEGDGDLTEDEIEGNDGTLVNFEPDGGWIEGRVGDAAIEFDGIDDHVLVANPDVFDFEVDFTWAAWIRTTAPGVNGAIISKSPTDDIWARGAKAIFVGRNGNRGDGTLTFDIGWVGFVASTARVDDGLWHHVALTVQYNVDGGVNDAAQLYVDGQPDGFQSGWDINAQAAAPGDVKFGYASTDFPRQTSYFAGAIDDVRFADYAMTVEEIQELVAAETECPEEGDTHCLGLTVEGPEDDAPGTYTITASAEDDSDDPIVYTFTADNGVDPAIVIGPQADPVATTTLGVGIWTISVLVDDSAACTDAADDNACSEGPIEIEIDEPFLSHWPLDDGGGLVAEDVESGNDGTLTNMDEAAWIRGRVGESALEFDGFDDYVVAENPDDYFFLADFTWTAWMQTAGEGTNGTIISKSPAVANWEPGSKALFVGSNGNRGDGKLAFDVGWVGVVASAPRVDDAMWHHVAVTAEFEANGINDRVTLWIDGEVDTVRDNWNLQVQQAATGEMKIGHGSLNFPTGGPYFRGSIDDVRVYRVALGAEDIADLASAEPEDCPEEGDTHCDGVEVLSIDGPSPFGGLYTVEVEASGTDDSDDTVRYTFVVEDDGVEVFSVGPQRESSALFRVPEGQFTLIVSVDDDALCADEADDASCSIALQIPPEAGVGPFLRGDCNGDGNVIGQVGDAVYVLNFNFTGGPVPVCMAACDSNGDGNVIGQVGDAIYTLNFNFLGGPAIPEPFPECGTSSEPRDEALGCEVPLECP